MSNLPQAIKRCAGVKVGSRIFVGAHAVKYIVGPEDVYCRSCKRFQAGLQVQQIPNGTAQKEERRVVEWMLPSHKFHCQQKLPA